ncbi:MAG TPA: M20/M25/M40 family metallo-hydrolase [Acidobacteriaceae bacterium]|nr:M20/M25/M40 family metallo-hydrolase [Acidobacteriaceae bacterium]
MPTSSQARITRLAANTSIHRAFQWLHLHQPQLRRWMHELLVIPAPPFGEAARAAWFLERFDALGLSDPHIDDAGNALALLPAAAAIDDNAVDPSSPVILLSAHLDTVFPLGTPLQPTEHPPRILAPGVCDNAAGLTGLLAIAAALRYAQFAPAVPILFAANVGEEGEGDLRGMRHLFTASPFASRIRAAIALEGAGTSAVVTRALASRRFRVTVTGPGGHAWADAGAPNPILALARALLALEAIPQSAQDSTGAYPRTTLNIGQIAGGSAINSIPASATAWIDLRSTDPAHLASAETAMRHSLDLWILHPPTRSSIAPFTTRPRPADPSHVLAIHVIGDRPGGSLPQHSPLLATLQAVDRHLQIRTDPGLGSTDANIPLSLGIPAIAIGAGGIGGGIHTLQEWYDPTGRETALRRILLTLVDTAAIAADIH